jgi:hypothetical protein
MATVNIITFITHVHIGVLDSNLGEVVVDLM